MRPVANAEREVLAALADGATEAQVATRLELKPARVQAVLDAACRELDTPTQIAAVAQALRRGLLR